MQVSLEELIDVFREHTSVKSDIKVLVNGVEIGTYVKKKEKEKYVREQEEEGKRVVRDNPDLFGSSSYDYGSQIAAMAAASTIVGS